jgi:hypothetical protein
MLCGYVQVTGAVGSLPPPPQHWVLPSVNGDKAQPHNALRFASLPEWKSLWNCIVTAAEMATLCASSTANIRLLFLVYKILFLLTCGPIYIWFSQDAFSPQDVRLPCTYFSTMPSTHLGHSILLDLTILISSDEQHQPLYTDSSVLLLLSRL